MDSHGIGARLHKLFDADTVFTDRIAFLRSAAETMAPMLLVIGSLILMERILEFDKVGYTTRELFSCSVLYIFIFALLTASPLHSALSKYVSDCIHTGRFEDVRPCFYLGMLFTVAFSALLGVPFCLREYFVGKVEALYVLLGYCGYISLTLVFYSMIYLPISKKYGRISLFFLIGMLVSFILSLALVWGFGWETTRGMLFSLVAGFLLIACLEIAQCKQYYRGNNNNYIGALRCLKCYWKLIFSNFLYTLGLCVHSFVFWTTDTRLVVADTFVCNRPYDMASCLAMFTNVSAAVIFTARVETRFRDCYRMYSESVAGGRGADIQRAKSRMFRQVSQELMSLARIQFIISVVVFLTLTVVAPRVGLSGPVMQIYPSLAAGYFPLFLMYSAVIFLYCLEDLTGALLTSLSFCLTTLIASIFAARLSPIWYGAGVIIGSLAGWTVAYARLRHCEKGWDTYVFCRGDLLESANMPRPSGKVFDRAEYEAQQAETAQEKERPESRDRVPLLK